MSWFRLARMVGAILIPLAVLESAAAEPRRVLLLHSFGPHFAPWNIASERFREELIKQSPNAIDLFESSLESARFAPAQDEGPFVDYLRALFAERNLDLVVAMGAPAARFFQRHRAQLFPYTPLLITGADERTIAAGALTPNDTVVAVTVEPQKLIENILQVMPDTTNIAVVIGNSQIERFWARELRHEFQRFSTKVSFEWWNELSLEDMLKRAASLPPHSAIFHTEVRVDAVGVPHAHDQVLARLRETAKAPIFSYLDNRLGHGIVGGPLLSSRDLGRQAATVAVRILGGETAGNIKTAVQGLKASTYDWRGLQRWNISEARLPPGSVVLFKVPTPWEQHRNLVLTTVGVLAVLISILVGLSMQMVSRKRAEASLKRSEERMAFAAASSYGNTTLSPDSYGRPSIAVPCSN